MPRILDTSSDGYNARNADCHTFWGVHQVHQPDSRTRTAPAWREHWYPEWLRHSVQVDSLYDTHALNDIYPHAYTREAIWRDWYVQAVCRYLPAPSPFCASRWRWLLVLDGR